MAKTKLTFKDLLAGAEMPTTIPPKLAEGARAVLGVLDPTTLDTWAGKVASHFGDMLLYTALPKVANEYCYIGSMDKADALNDVYAKAYGYACACDDYDARIDYYEKAKGKLLQAVRVKEGASDMPQSATLDELEESANKNDLSRVRVQLSDGGTLMARLAEVQTLYRSTMEEWANDFISRFIVYEGGDGNE